MKAADKIAKFLLLFGSILISLIFAEIACRSFEQARYVAQLRSWKSRTYKILPNKRYRYGLIPDSSRRRPVSNLSSTLWHNSINSEGFRGGEIGPKTDKIRILVLGDSCTFGWAVNDDETYPAQLESELKKRAPRIDVEIVNAGVPGYDTALEYALLLDIGDRIMPDVVILNYTVNDADPGGWGAIPDPPELIYFEQPSWCLAKCKLLCNTILTRYFNVQRLPFKVERYQPDYPRSFLPQSSGWKRSRQALKRIGDLCRERGIPLYVFVLPDFTQSLKVYPYESIHSEVKHWGEELSINVHDLLLDFQGLDHKTLIVPTEGHPNPLAYQRVSEKMADVILPQLLALAEV